MPAAEFDCPYCHQHFTIKQSLLTRRKGYARCPHCKRHFSPSQDTEETLIFDDHTGLDDDEAAQSTLQSPPSNPADDFVILDNINASVHDTSPIFAKEIQQTQELQDESWLEDLLADEPPKPDQTPPAPTAATALPHDRTPPLSPLSSEALPAYMHKVEQRLGSSSSSGSARHASNAAAIGWLLGSIVLGLLLVGQYVVFNANTLMQQPSGAAFLTRTCDVLPIDCHLAYANEAWADMQVLDVAGNTKHTDVIFRLTNTGNAPLLYPNLVITLRQGNTIKAQAAVPASLYAEPNSQYLLPSQIQAVKLRLDFPKTQVRQANVEPFYHSLP